MKRINKQRQKNKAAAIILAAIIVASMLMPSLVTEAKITRQKIIQCTICNDTKKCQTCDGTGLSIETRKELEELDKKNSEDIQDSKIKLSRNDYNGMLKTSHGQQKNYKCNEANLDWISGNAKNTIQIGKNTSSNESDNTYCKDCNGTGKCSACCIIDEADNGSAAAVEDDANMFVGKINGEDVIGYLDTTYVYYLSGKDYNASFVTLDENGAPKYKVYIRINKEVPVGTYSDAGASGSGKIYVCVYTEFNETSQKFDGGGYTFLDSDKDWTVELNNVEYADDGVFQGTIDGTCMPGRYNSSPVFTEVPISGSFHFKMQTIHPTMETYRADHSEYAAANDTSFVQSFGTPYSGASSGGSASSKTGSSVDHTCRTCGGTGSCKKCYGSGWITNSYSGKLQTCMRCQGSGKCAVCAGTGTVN